MAHGDGLTLLLLTFAVYRVAHVIAVDEGPFSVLDAIRTWIAPDQSTWLGRGIRCVACISFWLALGAALLIGGSVLDWLAMAGGAFVIHKAVNH